MADAARVCQDLGFDILDINFGCPVNKVVKCNGGSGLLRDLPLVGTLLRTVRAAINIPFTLQVPRRLERPGTGHGRDGAHSPRTAVFRPSRLHPRTREQGYSGQADWTRIAAVKAAVKIPVIGNGDIVTPEDAMRMVRETGLRRGDDRACRVVQSVDLPPDRTISRHRQLRSSLHMRTATK